MSNEIIPMIIQRQGSPLFKLERHLMTASQFGGNLGDALGRPGVGVLQNQRPPPPDGVAHILIVDDIAEIVEADAKVFLTSTSNRKPDLDVFP
jgi:hypothetical protein